MLNPIEDACLQTSGTENIYKIYAESFVGADYLQRILQEAQAIVDAAISPAPAP